MKISSVGEIAIKSLKHMILFPLLAISLFFLFIELSSYVALFFVNDVKIEKIKDASIKNFGWGEVTPHPYFGFVFTPNVKISDNPWFKDPKLPKDTFNIGIFGGSVAAQFGESFTEDELSKRFKEAIPSLKNKNLRFFNFAQGAHKQPQAFHIFMYYLDNIDLAINIEGWNEILPRSYHFEKENHSTTQFSDALPAFSEFLFNSTTKDITEVGELHFLTGIRDSLLNSKLNSLRLFGLAFDKWLGEAYLKTKTRLGGYNLSENLLQFQTSQIELRVKRWKKYSQAQHQISKSQKIKSYTFIQPNHHVPGSKIQHPEEKKMENATEYIQKAYLELEDEVKDLRKRGFKVYSLKNIFAGNSDLLYQDLEHLYPEGYSIMLDKILGFIQKDF